MAGMLGFGSAKAKKLESKYAPQFIRDIRNRLDAYFRLVVRNARDAIPKAVGFYLVLL